MRFIKSLFENNLLLKMQLREGAETKLNHIINRVKNAGEITHDDVVLMELTQQVISETAAIDHRLASNRLKRDFDKNIDSMQSKE